MGIDARNADESLKSLSIWTTCRVVESGTVCGHIRMASALISFSGTPSVMTKALVLPKDLPWVKGVAVAHPS